MERQCGGWIKSLDQVFPARPDHLEATQETGIETQLLIFSLNDSMPFFHCINYDILFHG